MERYRQMQTQAEGNRQRQTERESYLMGHRTKAGMWCCKEREREMRHWYLEVRERAGRKELWRESNLAGIKNTIRVTWLRQIKYLHFPY